MFTVKQIQQLIAYILKLISQQTHTHILIRALGTKASQTYLNNHYKIRTKFIILWTSAYYHQTCSSPAHVHSALLSCSALKLVCLVCSGFHSLFSRISSPHYGLSAQLSYSPFVAQNTSNSSCSSTLSVKHHMDTTCYCKK